MKKKGFSIIEALIAIAILTVVINIVLGVVYSGFDIFNYSRDAKTAEYLAKEGVEIVKGIRDSNIERDKSWSEGLDKCINDVCKVGLSDPLIVEECSNGECGFIKYNRETGEYGYKNSWVETDFVRKVSIIENEERMNVSVSVEWPQGDMIRKVEKEEELYDFSIKSFYCFYDEEPGSVSIRDDTSPCAWFVCTGFYVDDEEELKYYYWSFSFYISLENDEFLDYDYDWFDGLCCEWFGSPKEDAITYIYEYDHYPASYGGGRSSATFRRFSIDGDYRDGEDIDSYIKNVLDLEEDYFGPFNEDSDVMCEL